MLEVKELTSVDSFVLQKNQRILSGWGNYPTKQCTVFRPEREKDIANIYLEHGASCIARGAGNSYGDASLNREGVILSERINKFLDFNKERGIVRAQAGVTLAEILQITVPEGWLLPVIPGTKHATIAGAVAANIHGKNQYKSGEIASHIMNLKLRLPNREEVNCSPQENSEIFWATAGGMGMTGFIEEVALKLLPIESDKLKIETVRVKNIEEMAERMRRGVGDSEYMVGWIDHFGTGNNLGRGVFEKANHVKKSDRSLERYKTGSPSISVPFNMPSFLLNKYSMALYNKLKFASVSAVPSSNTKNFDGFFHPLDGIANWNRLYGKKGFLQYQMLVPESHNAIHQVRNILEKIQESGLFSFLAVIKYHAPREGIMSFSGEGFSIALDFPNTPEVHRLLDEIDEYVCDIRGRVYLAKDARMKQTAFEKMYADSLPKWRKILKQIDPARKIQSSMGRRLNFHGSK